MKGSLSDIRWIDLATFQDQRGCLTAAEVNHEIPFELKRIFLVHNVIQNRGGHAHRDTEQMLIAASGSLTVRVYDGDLRREFFLNKPNKALFIPEMIFVDLINFSNDGVCLSLASTKYDIEKSIRTIEEFEKEVL